MKKRARLSVQTLEAREVPAQFGIPWANGQALTVSFAPDGANVDGDANELAALMDRSGLSPDVWRTEILRAFQAWAAIADLNIGQVSDSGAPLGMSGHEQADSRFGDIRIFAVPLSGSVVAITTPPGDLGGTRAGDIILNSNYNFGAGGYDLYTVLRHEAGHALGVGNSPDLTSAMYEFYQGTRTGLSADDVAKARALYGTRPAATWEPAGGNDATAAATVLGGTGTLVSYGDLASTGSEREVAAIHSVKLSRAQPLVGLRVPNFERRRCVIGMSDLGRRSGFRVQNEHCDSLPIGAEPRIEHFSVRPLGQCDCLASGQ